MGCYRLAHSLNDRLKVARLRTLLPLLPFALGWIVVWAGLAWAFGGTEYWFLAGCVGLAAMMIPGQLLPGFQHQ